MNLIDLKTAKYKGVGFLFTEMPTTGGNRLIKFNFPGSDAQAIERQGKAPRSFTITAIIPDENYFQERDNLLRVLEDGETGVLTHPTFGDIENVINGRYTLTEKLSELGRGEILIPFEINDSAGIPVQSGNLASQVQAQGDALNAQLTADLAGTYEVSSSLSGNFSDAIDNLNNVVDSFTAASQVADPITEKAAEFRRAVTDFSGQIGDLITAPADLATEISGLFDALNVLYETPGNTFAAFKSLFDFGSGDLDTNTNTVARVQRKQNRDLIRANMRTQSLSYTYVSAVEGQYQTTDNLDLVQSELEAQYVDVRENQLITNEALELLDRERVVAQKTLDDARVNTRTTILIETPRLPLSFVVYRYYGNTDLFDTIAELNDIQQNAFVEGELRILTA